MAENKAGASYLMVRCPPELRAQVNAYAEREQRSISNTVRFALGRLFEEDHKQRVDS